ncbi:MAG TPA: LCP family protein [Symbiobacteriaceae bacterium]|nr:LCP family protein [Symbiobacteriaceae bacterium]
MIAPARRSARRRRRPNYWARRLALLLIILLPIVAWAAWNFSVETLQVTPERSAPRVVANKPVFVAVMGVDERAGDTGRSDTLLLVRLDPDRQTIHTINIPRDTLITYASGNQSKINAAYAIDGPELVTEVVADLLGVDRPYYVTVNFKAFEELVDAVGGVPITVDKHYVYDDPYQDLHIDIPAGHQVLMGEQALHYVRLRYDGVTNSDIGRINRQQEFLKAFKDRIPANWNRIPKMVQTVKKHIRTNIPEDDQLKLVLGLFNARHNLSVDLLPGTPDDATGDWLLDKAAWNEVVRSWQTKTN